MKQHIDTITDLLLGAAYADKRLEGDELISISKLLCKVLGTDELPEAQSSRIGSFNPAKADTAAAAKSLAGLSESEKIKVLDLIATVNESDDVLDLDEDAYLRKVAHGMGLSDDDIEGMTIEILEEEELEGLLDD
jgi:uncharacterized tellurite resistance protein B-like protein